MSKPTIIIWNVRSYTNRQTIKCLLCTSTMLRGTGDTAMKNTQPDLMGVSHQSIRTITKVSGCYGRKILFSRIILPAQRSTKNSSRQTLRMYFSMRVGRWKRGEVSLSTVQISTDLSAMPWKHRALPPSAQEFKKGLHELRNSALTLQQRESDTQVGRWYEDP